MEQTKKLIERKIKPSIHTSTLLRSRDDYDLVTTILELPRIADFINMNTTIRI